MGHTVEEYQDFLGENNEEFALLEEEEEEEEFFEDSPEVEMTEIEEDGDTAGLMENVVATYLHQIGKVPLLSAQEEVAIFQCIEEGKAEIEQALLSSPRTVEEVLKVEAEIRRGQHKVKAAKEAMISANLKLVVSLAKRYISTGLPILDLIQEGNLGLMRAVEKFDYRRGHKFSTYAVWWIWQAISRAAAEQRRTIRLPLHMTELFAKIQKTSDALSQRLGRTPTPQEIGIALDLPLHKVQEVLQCKKEAIPLDEPIGEEEESTVGDFIANDRASSPLEDLLQKDLETHVDRLLDELLTKREAKVLRLRFGINEARNHTLREIGEYFGVSRERIRQIEKSALQKLRHFQRRKEIGDFLAS